MENIYEYAQCLEDLEDRTLTFVVENLRKSKTQWDVLKLISALAKSAETVHQVLAETLTNILNGATVYPVIERKRRLSDPYYGRARPLNDIGEAVMRKMNALNISQTKAAKKIGVSPSTLSRWMRGRMIPVGENKVWTYSV